MTISDTQLDQTATTYKPWRWTNLDSMTASQAKLFTAIAAWGGQIDLSHAHGKITFVPGQRPEHPFKMLYLEVWIGNHAFDVYADPQIIQEIIEKAGFTQNLGALDMHSLALTCDHLLGPVIKSLSAQFDGKFTVLDAYLRTTAGPEDALCLAVRSATKKERPVLISIPDPTLETMALTLSKTKRKTASKQNFIKFTHAASYRAASVWLTSTELAALQVEDGLMLPDGWSPKQIDKLVLGSASAFPAEVVDGGLKIVGPATHAQNQQQEKPAMKHDPHLEVELSIEVARGRFDTSTIETVTEGAILPFPTAVGSYVTLLCNEEPVATGELVEIDGAFGVRITKTI